MHTKSDILLKEELGIRPSDSVPWRLPLNESIYVSYGGDEPGLCGGLEASLLHFFLLILVWHDDLGGLAHCASIC